MNTRSILVSMGISFSCALALCCTAGFGYFLYIVSNVNHTQATGTEAPTTNEPTIFHVKPTPTPAGMVPADCLNKITDILAANQGSTYSPDNSSGGSSGSDNNPDMTTLVVYQVDEDQVSNPSYDKVSSSFKKDQQNTTAQEQAWQFFTELIPFQDRQMVSEYEVFTDGPDNVLAAVEQTDTDPSKWTMEIDIEDLQDKNELAFTLVHETAHLLTLNSEQVPPDIKLFNDPNNDALYNQEATTCSTYFTQEGCSEPKSYINQYYQRFWPAIADEWKKIDKHSNDSNPTEYYKLLYDFYLKHIDQFVDDYATTDPSEDIAESFAYFIYSPKPTSLAIKDQKISFFYQYPELVHTRSQILNNTCSEIDLK